MAFPALSETYWAARGGGAYRNGSSIQVDDRTPLREATLLFTDASPAMFGDRYDDFVRLEAAVGRCRGWGDCYGYALLASGRSEIMIDPALNPWDIAAVLPILEEAGGRFVGWNGREGIWAGSGIGTTASLQAEVLELLGVPTPEPRA